jgi:drug/metabolite transporter (DMT)-like permease
MQPMLTAALSHSLFDEKVSRRQWAGLGLGLCGVTLVVWDKIGKSADMTAYLPVLVALAGITSGTLYQKKFCAAIPLVTGTLLQYVACALAFGLLAACFEGEPVRWTPAFLFALGWLTLVLSVGAIFLLFLMIRHGQAARVTSLFYLTPPSTAIFAWLLFDEVLSPLALVGFALAVVGVTLARR